MVVTERGCNFILYYGAWSAREARVAMIWGSENFSLKDEHISSIFPRPKQERRQLPQLSRFLAVFVTLCRQKNIYRRSFTFWSLLIISSRFSERRYSKIIRLGQGPTKAEMRRKKNCCFLMLIHTPYGHLILFSFHYFNEFRKILILILKKQ